MSRRTPLTPGRVVDAGLALADAQGLDAVSMRAIASTLGVTPMSLYNHVANKDDLIDLMLNEVLGEVTPPQIGGDWKGEMRARAISLREMFLRHRWAPVQLISRITTGEALMRDHDRTTGCLVEAGFSYAEADWVRNAIESHVYGFTLQELNMPVAPEQYRQAAAEYLPHLPKEQFPYMHGGASAIVSGTYDGVVRFTFGLDLILDGLDQWKAKGAPR